ncbi:sensor histidine kinase [Parahaliea aestuarii]|uniref:histidine kinase n=1 Tax=Parahaliea aestuarii TaxID=1852021 RepID=A0A5C8ZPY3_9GAMM|nr:sensor histidine kinase [Parahaliea aestuarii]TXS90395.1 sensor histidine kinase [Parahaliea aestuarii]
MPRLGLRAQLLLLVGGPLFLLLLVETLVSYAIGLHTANQIFDRWLLDSAYSLAHEVQRDDGEIRFRAEPTAIEMFEWDEFDSVYFHVARLNGEYLAGRPQAWLALDNEQLRAGPFFTDTHIDGSRVRSVSVLTDLGAGEAAIISVAETLNKRTPLVETLLAEVLGSKLLFFIAALFVVGVAVQRGIRPLLVLRRELARRSSRDLTPIEVHAAPEEVELIVENTNLLLRQLEAAIDSREQFVGNISHQMKTPLAGIKLQAQLALREDDLASVHSALDATSRAADRMAHVNAQLMKLARAEAAVGRGLQVEPVDLTEVVNDVVENLHSLLLSRDVRVELELPPQVVEVLGEYMLLREMCWNLFENAARYVHIGGTVWVTLEIVGSEVILIVEDNGPGIAQRHWPRLFERFYRCDATNPEGCGLGLPIVREIALAHGAAVDVVAPVRATGARLVVVFPAMAS